MLALMDEWSPAFIPRLGFKGIRRPVLDYFPLVEFRGVPAGRLTAALAIAVSGVLDRNRTHLNQPNLRYCFH